MAQELQGIGPYQLLEVIAEGERSTLYLATDEGRTRQLALKVLHPQLVSDPDEVAAFEARAQVARRLSHSGIAAIHEIGSADGRPWVAMELVDGEPLGSLFPKRGRPKLAVPAAGAVVRDVLTALVAASDEEIVHGRLDVGDVLVGHDGRVTVSGFGTEGPPETDLIAVAQLVQTLTPGWPPEVDLWLDRLQHGDDSYGGPEDALTGFPVLAAATESEGRRLLARLVKRVRTKREKEARLAAERAQTEPGAPTAEPGADAASEPPDKPKKVRKKRAKKAPRPRADRPPTETGLAARQARWVFALCALVLVLALAIEVWTFTD